MKSNCLFFSIYLFITRGGFIVFEKSKYGPWVHVLWTKDFIKFYHFVPKKVPLKYPFISKIYFKGKIRIKKRSLCRDSFNQQN